MGEYSVTSYRKLWARRYASPSGPHGKFSVTSYRQLLGLAGAWRFYLRFC